jgi:hypothetical protein
MKCKRWNQKVVWAMKANEVQCVEIDESRKSTHAMKWRKIQM